MCVLMYIYALYIYYTYITYTEEEFQKKKEGGELCSRPRPLSVAPCPPGMPCIRDKPLAGR